MDSMETPIENLIGEQDDVEKKILEELEKHKVERDKMETSIQELVESERREKQKAIPPPVRPQQPPQPSPQLQPSNIQGKITKIQEKDFDKEFESDNLVRDMIVIALVVFLINQPSISKLILPNKVPDLMKGLILAGASGVIFYLYKKNEKTIFK